MNDMLSLLLVGHMVGDFLLQTSWMAERKTTDFAALVVHSAAYTCSVWLVSLAGQQGGLSPQSVILVFFSHAVIDRRGLVFWWCRHVTRSDSPWLFTVTDQTLHCVILAVAYILEKNSLYVV